MAAKKAKKASAPKATPMVRCPHCKWAVPRWTAGFEGKKVDGHVTLETHIRRQHPGKAG